MPVQNSKPLQSMEGVAILRLSGSLAITTPLPPLAVIMKPALMTEMMARPSALAIT